MTKTDEIWVDDPASNKKVNITPFLATLNDLDRQASASLSSGAVDIIERVIRTLNTTVHQESITSFAELADLNFDLYRLRDMFKATVELPISDSE